MQAAGPSRTVRLLVLADAGLAIALCAASLGYRLIQEPGSSGLELAAIVAATLPLLARRRWPLVVLGMAVAAESAHLLFAPDHVLGPWLGGGLLAFYSVARHRSRPTAAAALAGASIAYLAVAVVGAGGRLAGYAPLLAWWLAATVGDSAREHAAELERQRRQREHRAVLEERARISRELHDVVAHHLSVMVVQAGAALTLLEDARSAPAAASVSAIEETGRQALSEMRRLLGALRASDGSEASPLTPPPGLADVQGLAEQVTRAGLPVEVVVHGTSADVSAAVDRAAYRIVQEALTNALRHAGPARARVRIRHLPELLEIEVTDTGTGGMRPMAPGHGIPGMRERATLCSGELNAGPRDGGGFAVRARLPLRAGLP